MRGGGETRSSSSSSRRDWEREAQCGARSDRVYPRRTRPIGSTPSLRADPLHMSLPGPGPCPSYPRTSHTRTSPVPLPAPSPHPPPPQFSSRSRSPPSSQPSSPSPPHPLPAPPRPARGTSRADQKPFHHTRPRSRPFSPLSHSPLGYPIAPPLITYHLSTPQLLAQQHFLVTLQRPPGYLY